MFGKAIGQTDGCTVGIMYNSLTHSTLKIFHCSHLRISGLISFAHLANTRKQIFPHLHKRMGLSDQHKMNMISHYFAIALYNMRQIHKCICYFTRSIDDPRLFGLTKEPFETFADYRTSDVKHEIRYILLIVAYQHHSLIHQWIHGLTTDQQRTL